MLEIRRQRINMDFWQRAPTRMVRRSSAMRPNPSASIFVIFSLLLSGVRTVWAQQDPSSTMGFGGAYASLRPQQKSLIDDWFKRFSALIKKPVAAAEGYDNLPLSARTTFNAVTHALLATKLTDNSGKSLAESTMDLVDKVDRLAGEILGARGDEQFRMYVQMKPGVLELLNRSKEFKRGHDNTIYHHGYPICFRSIGGTPSIQVSLTRDAARADIDVDYRSSKFPAFLVNGHLSASNSDVRAGNNDTRHNNRWSGLQNWWRNLLGLPIVDKTRYPSIEGRVIPGEPKLKGAKPADAIYEFLNGWLVEQKPDESVPYIADECFACMEVESRTQVDHGMARFAMLLSMMEANRRIGKVSSLSDASVGVAVAGERVKVIEQPHHSQFVLYDVREDLAEEFNCVNRLDSSQITAKAMKSKAFGKYVGALFRIKWKDQTGETIATLWRKERDYWRLISYDIDPEIDRSRVPNVGAQLATAPSLQYVAGDKEMIKSASDFMKQWLVKKDVDRAMEYIAPECLTCVKYYLDDEVQAPSTLEESRAVFNKGMAGAAAAAGDIKNLDSAIVAPQPHHQDFRLVKHRDAEAFVIASIPEYMGEAASCERRNQAGEPDHIPQGASGYGKYYATGFSFTKGKANPSVLWMAWSKRDGAWKAVSFVLMTP
jgi:hypothetical protein